MLHAGVAPGMTAEIGGPQVEEGGRDGRRARAREEVLRLALGSARRGRAAREEGSREKRGGPARLTDMGRWGEREHDPAI